MLPGVAKGALPALQQLAELSFRLAATGNAVREYAANHTPGMSSRHVAVTNKGRKAGPEGRSSVSGITATVFGANGFVGSYVTNEIAKRGSQVVVPYRSVQYKVQHVQQMGDLGQMVMIGEFDIRNEEMVRHSLSRSNVVINMIGQRMETMNFSFEDVHIDWPKRLAKIVAESPQVERFIHFSDIGAHLDHKSRRLRTKAEGDKLVQEIYPDATIIRPGPIVGIEDHFYNHLIYQVAFGLAAPVIDGGVARVQPTFVLDVATAVTNILRREESAGKTYYLGGPEVLTYRQLYDVIIKALRMHHDQTVHVPAWLAKLMWAPKDYVRKMLPALPMSNWMSSADYVEEVAADKIVPAGALAYKDLDISPAKVTDGLPMEPVRHYRVGGYRWGDMATVASSVPEHIKKYYNLK